MVYVDRPVWPAHGRRWAHLVSDAGYAELHAFAELIGAPRRGFDRDHYDVPTQLHQIAVWLGANQVSSRELVARLLRSGLRRPKMSAKPSAARGGQRIAAEPGQLAQQVRAGS